MKKLIFKTLFLSPLLVFILFVTYTEDPGQLIKRKDVEKKMAQAMREGKHIVPLRSFNFDDRLLNKYYIEEMKESLRLL